MFLPAGRRTVGPEKCMFLGRACPTPWMMLSGCPHFRARSSRRSFGRKTILPMMTGKRVATKSRLSTGLRVPETSLGPSGRHGSSKMPSKLAARQDQGLRPPTKRSGIRWVAFQVYLVISVLNLPKYIHSILNSAGSPPIQEPVL